MTGGGQVAPPTERRGHTVKLFAPVDWTDLLEEPDEVAWSARCADLIGRAFPQADTTAVEEATRCLLAWRASMVRRGMVSYGLAGRPAGPDADGVVQARADWIVLTGVVDTPEMPGETDLAGSLAAMSGQRLQADRTYTEAFETDMGRGFGLISQPSFPSVRVALDELGRGVGDDLEPDTVARTDVDVRFTYGLAVALAYGLDGGRGVLVTGVCLDPDQVLELAGLVAVMAGRSRIKPNDSAPGEEP